MPQFGSNPSVTAQNLSATQDQNGNAIISPDNAFGGSPLGVASRTQALYSLPNAHFELTCADPNLPVEVDNPIPYWQLEYSGTIATTMVFNATTQNWSVRMDPTGAAAGDFAILKSRAYLLNDDALALRQKAYASLTKQGSTGTAQWSIVLSATYYDQTGAQLSTYNIGTAADTGTWTGINGVTTSGSAAISTNAAYADIALTLTAAGSVSGTAKVDINSVLLATSQAAGGGSFLLAQTFTSSGTWTRPTGVDYVTVVVQSAGEGGSGGKVVCANTTTAVTLGGGGGQSGAWALVRDIYLGTATSVSVGVGAGGNGGAGTSFTKAAAGTTQANLNGTGGAQGGDSNFGSYITVPGGGNTTGITFNFLSLGGGTAAKASGGNSDTPDKAGSASANSAYSQGVPYTTFISGGGAAGVAGTVTAGQGALNGTAGIAGTALGISGGGGGGGNGTAAASPTAATGGAGGSGGGGGGGGVALSRANGTATTTLTGGAGGTAASNSGSGGGGGGGVGVAAASIANYNTTAITATSGAGGKAGNGFVTVVWTG